MLKFTFKEQYVKENGIEVKINSTLFVDFNNYFSIDTFALFRENEGDEWKLCKDQSKFSREEIRKMSRAQYLREGRSELLEIVGVGKLLKTADALLKHARESLSYEIKPHPIKIGNY